MLHVCAQVFLLLSGRGSGNRDRGRGFLRTRAVEKERTQMAATQPEEEIHRKAETSVFVNRAGAVEPTVSKSAWGHDPEITLRRDETFIKNSWNENLPFPSPDS